MWRFWIDTGGTFTDCLATSPSGEELRIKVLSSTTIRGECEWIDAAKIRLKIPYAVKDGFFVGYRAQIEDTSYEVIDWSNGLASLKGRDASPTCLGEASRRRRRPISLCSLHSPEEAPVLAARLLTNTRLDEPLPPMEMRLATTRGTNALLEGKGARVAFFVTSGFGDLLRIGNQQRPDLFAIGIQKPEPLHSLVCEIPERVSAQGEVIERLDESAVERFIGQAKTAKIESVAVALLNSYRNPAHERRVEELLRAAGFSYVSVSSSLSPSIKLLPRAATAVVDAYLAPIMDAYLDAAQSNVSGRLRIMTSAGGLVSRASYRPKDSLLSGPAGGVVGSSSVGSRAGFQKTIAFDMGGTSADLSRFDGGLDYQFEQVVGSARIQAPSLRIETVAAGGGSVCWYDGAALRVGPHSAGAHPGPACYGAGGPLTLTDVNLLLDRLDGSQFSIPIYRERAEEKLAELIGSTDGRVSRDDALRGFLRIANERMAEATRAISARYGYDASEYAMVAFGGAGGLHACEMAELLGMRTVLVPADSGLLSAYGLRRARLEAFAERGVIRELAQCLDQVAQWTADLENEAIAKLAADGVGAADAGIANRRYELRFKGQDAALVVEDVSADRLQETFVENYAAQFGFVPDGLPVELVAIRVIAATIAAADEAEVFSEGRNVSPGIRFVDRSTLASGDSLSGPLVIQDGFSTTYLASGWRARVGSRGTLRLESEGDGFRARRGSEVVDLELFTNRFLSIVGEMGAQLERTAFSTNVKERLDFSCALLDADGYLVANAPHIPVHLGALGVCLRSVLPVCPLEPGDVVVTNHPGYGGSHLPDVTLLSGVYSDDGDLIGYVANRAHHAEFGGISPGSMPPHARNLEEEGVVIAPMYLARAGVVDWDNAKVVLSGARYPTRSLAENVADLAAQLASIRLGEKSLRRLARIEGRERVRGFMSGLRKRSADALRSRLEELMGEIPRQQSQPQKEGAVAAVVTAEEQEESIVAAVVTAEERFDNGCPIRVSVGPEGDRWLIDFAGSGPVQPNNYNATPAIVTSAVIYVMRLLARTDVPLNEGFLDVVDIRIPEGLLNPVFPENPADCPAVVAGNVEVSQRVVDTLIKAFGLAACSQGTMNNFIFGDASRSYYETIAGGEGASPERPGASGTHVHMTNTAITDPEIFELRYPIRLEAFALRPNSGGSGKHRGGDGVIRRIRFLKPVTLALLSQHRKVPPFGMNGGHPGSVGEQLLIRPDGSREALPGDCQLQIEAGFAIEIRTPGGGGWGEVK